MSHYAASSLPFRPDRRLIMALGCLMVWSCNPATREEVDALPIYQVVETINAELTLLLGAINIETPVVQTTPPLTPRQPRHVVQKAREVLLKVQFLRTLNGLPENPVPPFPVQEAEPADSKRMVDAIHHDLGELRSKFKVTGTVAMAPLVAGKNPTDVYEALQHTSDTLDLLSVPRTMPNDACRVAVMIVDELEIILTARHRPLPSLASPSSDDRNPDEAYLKTFEVLDHLKAKTEADPALMVHGGVVLPNRRSLPFTPAHVLDLENNLLAELGAVKAALGIAIPVAMPPLIHGKTPSDTIDLLARALALVDAL